LKSNLSQFVKGGAVWAATALLLGACTQQEPAQMDAPKPAAVNTERLLAADSEPGNWMAHGRTYSEQRYSPLTQISDKNVSDLGLEWHFDLGDTRGIKRPRS